MATITKRRHGYCVQIRRKGFDPVTRYFKSHAEAVAWANKEEAKRSSLRTLRQLFDPRKITLRDVLTRYIEDVSARKISRETEQYRVAKLLRAPVCALTLYELSPNAIAQYRNNRLLEAKPSTVCRELHIIKQAINIAKYEWGYDIEENPAEFVKYPKIRNARSRRVSEYEIELVVDALNENERDDIVAVFLFAIQTAMRRGEILTLQWHHVDLKRRTAHLPMTKNGFARTVPLTNAALDILRSRKSKKGSVFGVTSDALKMCWRRIMLKTGIEDLHFHDLRHEAISRFFELGLSMPEVALISGHRDPRMLFRYTHLVPYQLAEKLSSL